MAKEIAASPVLAAFDVQVRVLRGRYYLQWSWTPLNVDDLDEVDEPEERISYGRITPVDGQDGPLLLEIERSQGSWSKVASDSAKKLIRTVAGDTKGSFHGLGALDKSLRRAGQAGVDRLPVKQVGTLKFVFADTDEACSVPEALYHHFGLPIPVIAQPARWYFYHRQPAIVESSADGTRILVRFTSSSWSGETFGGTCLDLVRDGQWGAYTIRPNQSDNIATAEAWLVKRKWKPW